jgi:hypothetical protein
MSKNGTVMVACARCGNVKLHHARGCCKCCYNKVVARGLQALFPTGFGLPSRYVRDDDPTVRVLPRTVARPGLHSWKQGGMH